MLKLIPPLNVREFFAMYYKTSIRLSRSDLLPLFIDNDRPPYHFSSSILDLVQAHGVYSSFPQFKPTTTDYSGPDRHKKFTQSTKDINEKFKASAAGNPQPYDNVSVSTPNYSSSGKRPIQKHLRHYASLYVLLPNNSIPL